MEYIGTLTLLQHLKNHPKNKVPEQEYLSIFKSLLKAIHYLHCKNIVHRDIKLENIMMDPVNVIKLIDFGLSACFYDEDNEKIDNTLLSVAGTLLYLAPECLNHQLHRKV